MEKELRKVMLLSNNYSSVAKGQIGLLHQFSVQGSYENGIMTYAIVEFEDGICRMIEINDFKFIK